MWLNLPSNSSYTSLHGFCKIWDHNLESLIALSQHLLLGDYDSQWFLDTSLLAKWIGSFNLEFQAIWCWNMLHCSPWSFLTEKDPTNMPKVTFAKLCLYSNKPFFLQMTCFLSRYMPPITSLPSLQKLEDFANGDTGANPLAFLSQESSQCGEHWKQLEIACCIPVSSVRCVYP